MKIDLIDHQGVQEYLYFLHGEIKTHEATIAEQGADIARLKSWIEGRDKIMANQAREIYELRGSIEGALKCSDLWLPTDIDDINEGQALCAMRDSFTKLVGNNHEQ